MTGRTKTAHLAIIRPGARLALHVSWRARMPRQHRMAAYVAERDKGGDVAELQRAVREQYEIDKLNGVAS